MAARAELLLALSLLLITLLPSGSHSAPQSAQIVSLPGFNGSFASKHYAGYITIDEQNGRALYYYLVTSEGNPSSDPLVLWLNGGPGCSSFDGFIYEHGPFTFRAAAELNGMPMLEKNPYSWTKIANVIYLDSPAGVGFSYSNTSTDLHTGDVKTSLDSHQFLLKWFGEYPEFLANDFYIVGESYAGVYVPTLAYQIANGLGTGVQPTINLKGYMVGNGVTDKEFDGNALVPFVYGMGLISVDLYQEASQECMGSYWKPNSERCAAVLKTIDKEVADINVYDILEPCYHDPSAWTDYMSIKLPQSVRMLGERQRGVPIRKRMFGRAWPLKLRQELHGIAPNWQALGGDVYVPCTDTHVSTIWLNNPEVRQALHALPESAIGKWILCTNAVNYTWDWGSMIPVHKNLTSKGYRAHIYSGDHDMCVPYTGSEAWTRSLGYTTLKAWYPWYVGNQVAGYSVIYDNGLTFSTIKGAGHTVPEYKPVEALAMLKRWLAGSPL